MSAASASLAAAQRIACNDFSMALLFRVESRNSPTCSPATKKSSCISGYSSARFTTRKPPRNSSLLIAPLRAMKKAKTSHCKPQVSATASTNESSSGIRKATRQATLGEGPRLLFPAMRLASLSVAEVLGVVGCCPGHCVGSDVSRGEAGQKWDWNARSGRMADLRTSSKDAESTCATEMDHNTWRQPPMSVVARKPTALSIKLLATPVLLPRHAFKAQIIVFDSLAGKHSSLSLMRGHCGSLIIPQGSSSTMAANICSEPPAKSGP
mmetsp:Transcript_135990/g.435004  ORF Transcript_135990/g.435004 Transcript_135990/m.435004 type:complete len:267 (-) Transcript_135990:799-1599(-)